MTPAPSPEERRALIEAARRKLVLAHTREGIAGVVRTAARAVTGADGVTFVLGECSRCHYMDENAIGPLWKGQRFPMSICVSGWAMLNGRTAVIDDIYADSRVLHEVYRETFVKSMIMVPVRANAPVAAIGAYWAEKRSFGDDDIWAIEALADRVGEAMRNAALAA